MIFILVFISLSVLILVHEAGHFLTAKIFGVKVEEFGFGFPPRLWSKKMGGTVYSLNLLPFGGFVKIYGEDGEGGAENGDSRGSFIAQPAWRKAAILLAGVFMNVFLGWLVLSSILMVGAPEHLILSDVALNSPAATAGLKQGDIVLSASYLNTNLADPVKSDDLIALVKSAGGNPIDLSVQRSKTVLNFSVRGRLNPPAGEGALGVALTEIGFKALPFFQSFSSGFQETWQIIKLVTVGFYDFFSKLFVQPKIIETITGPVGIFSLAAQAGAYGLIYFFQLMALISINLAVLNLIPFPALDGGRFFLLLIEKIKGSPISKKIQIAVNALGFAFLIILMIAVTIQDIGKLMK